MNYETAVIWYIAFVVSATVHEAAHAWSALLGGDRTAYRGGQVTLNPIPHIQREPIGMVLLPLVTLAASGGNWCFGFATTPIDPIWAWHNPRKAAVMSLAGPVANLLLAAIAWVVLYAVGRPGSGEMEAVHRIAGTFLLLNVIMMVFNLIPLPPLDGAGVVKGFGRPARLLMENLERLPYVAIVTFVLANKVMPYLFLPVFVTVNRWLPYPYRPF